MPVAQTQVSTNAITSKLIIFKNFSVAAVAARDGGIVRCAAASYFPWDSGLTNPRGSVGATSPGQRSSVLGWTVPPGAVQSQKLDLIQVVFF